MKDEIRRGRSVVYSLNVHLVFVTKYRRGVITDRVRGHLKAILTDVCLKIGAELREFDGEDDHVHLLVNYPPKLAISRLVNSLKLVSARLLRKRNLPEVRQKLWGNHFWTPATMPEAAEGPTSPPSCAISKPSEPRLRTAGADPA